MTGFRVWPPQGRFQHGLCWALSALSLVGLAVSLWAHLETVLGFDPSLQVHDIWLLQLILSALLIPIMLQLLSSRDPAQLLRCPRWIKGSLYALLGYYGLNFYVFLYWSVDHLTSRLTWRMISSGWLLLFALASAYYHVRFSESK